MEKLVVYGKNVIALLEEEKRKNAGGSQEDNANFEKRGFFATTSRQRPATNGCEEWDRSKNASRRENGGKK